MCCGTKRLVEIQCPGDCPWLAGAREHPPAVVVRQHQRDVGALMEFLRDFNRRQSQLFLMISTFLVRYEAPVLQPLIDEDIVEGMGALAGTFETASRGVIYEHRPESMAAERLASALKPILSEAGQGAGSAFERDAAVVLRRVADAARGYAANDRRAFLDLLSRMITRTAGAGDPEVPAGSDTPERLIVP